MNETFIIRLRLCTNALIIICHTIWSNQINIDCYTEQIMYSSTWLPYIESGQTHSIMLRVIISHREIIICCMIIRTNVRTLY